MQILKKTVTIIATLVATACSTVPQHHQNGMASWYGRDFHGRKTASGERFDMYQLTAAHRSLPFGTTVLVSCPSTGRSVKVRINDRGPYAHGRIIDLSYQAARELGLVQKGAAPVELTIAEDAGSRKPAGTR